ncbi:MAG: alcohol dehydrogenase [Gammaproteobacteria bacterium RBG_16_66_13]|nr:MAG: alcohol dehydrogenase [Gammaproteobacteria bacterium RBG_16_66_13]
MTGDAHAPFEFSTAGRVVFGAGTLEQAGEAVSALGRRALVVTTRSGERASRLLHLLERLHVAGIRFTVPSEPTIDLVRQGVQQAREYLVEVVVGIGGGSSLDAAKAVGLLFAQPGDPLEYLEVIGSGRPMTGPGLPVVAIPTTGGTGAEVTRNAVLASPEHGVKVSLRSHWLLPRLAIVDPELTLGAPADVTARCGFDALTQLVEPFLSTRANPLTDGLCREGIRLAGRSLRRAAQLGDEVAAHTDMSLAALLSGMALANAGLGIIHGLASVLGGLLPAPHGAICARVMSPALRENLSAMRSRQPDHPALGRMAELGGILTGDARAEAAIEWSDRTCDELGIPRLSAYGLNESMMAKVIEGAQRASSTRANPIPLTEGEIATILRSSM